eukprot:403352751
MKLNFRPQKKLFIQKYQSGDKDLQELQQIQFSTPQNQSKKHLIFNQNQLNQNQQQNFKVISPWQYDHSEAYKTDYQLSYCLTNESQNLNEIGLSEQQQMVDTTNNQNNLLNEGVSKYQYVNGSLMLRKLRQTQSQHQTRRIIEGADTLNTQTLELPDVNINPLNNSQQIEIQGIKLQDQNQQLWNSQKQSLNFYKDNEKFYNLREVGRQVPRNILKSQKFQKPPLPPLRSEKNLNELTQTIQLPKETVQSDIQDQNLIQKDEQILKPDLELVNNCETQDFINTENTQTKNVEQIEKSNLLKTPTKNYTQPTQFHQSPDFIGSSLKYSSSRKFPRNVKTGKEDIWIALSKHQNEVLQNYNFEQRQKKIQNQLQYKIAAKSLLEQLDKDQPVTTNLPTLEIKGVQFENSMLKDQNFNQNQKDQLMLNKLRQAAQSKQMKQRLQKEILDQQMLEQKQRNFQVDDALSKTLALNLTTNADIGNQALNTQKLGLNLKPMSPQRNSFGRVNLVNYAERNTVNFKHQTQTYNSLQSNQQKYLSAQLDQQRENLKLLKAEKQKKYYKDLSQQIIIKQQQRDPLEDELEKLNYFDLMAYKKLENTLYSNPIGMEDVIKASRYQNQMKIELQNLSQSQRLQQ